MVIHRETDAAMTWEPDAEDLAFYRRYGPWAPVDPAGAQALMRGYREPWWVVGGYAMEAFSGVLRRHEDCDVVIFAKDLPLLRDHFEGRFDLWAVGSGALRPLDSRFPELPDWAGQVWLREHALAPWRLDCIVNPDVDGKWQSKRDESHVADLEDVTWVDDRAIRFLNPEITLLHKAKQSRPKDEYDLDNAWPLLTRDKQQWLRDAVRRYDPDHPWNARLADA